MYKLPVYVCGLAVAAMAGLHSTTAAAEIGVGIRGGTLGVTYEATFGLNDYLAIRAGLSRYDSDYDTTEDDIDYNFNADLDSRHILLDYHPFRGSFRISGGIFDQQTQFTGLGTSSTGYTIGNRTYTPAEIGTVAAGIGWDDRYPYLGIGFGTSPNDEGFGFSLDLGLVFQESPTVEVNVASPLLADPIAGPELQANIELEEEQLRNDVDEFDTYPVISIGLSYHF